MADNSIDTLKNNITAYQYNPAGIQSVVLSMLSDITDGKITIVDPTSPFVMALESAAVMTSVFLSKNEANTRKQYPFSAQIMDDLYLHMSDKDYVNRFATPSTTKISLLLALDELISKMVLDQNTGIRKLIIPRNTVFSIIGIDFSIQYPIEIRQLQHGGLQVVYDADLVSPLQSLDTNVIDFEIRTSTDGDYLFFEVDVQQFNIISNTGSLTSATDYKLDIAITDQFYHCRVYVETSANVWTEIKTTHTDQIYDPFVPTAVIKVVDKLVSVSIPQIYTGTSMLNKSIRIDVYQTKGPKDIILWEYPMSAFSAKFIALDPSENNAYVAPIKTLKTIIIYSDKVVSGGSDGLTFDELRSQVITNAIGAPSLPITNAQIETALEINNYTIVKNIDNITNRVFLATRNMPQPTDRKMITAANASIGTLSITLESLLNASTVIDNNTSITIRPSTIYKTTNGIISVVPDDEIDNINNLSMDQVATVVTNGNYLFTPFHYVLDMSNSEFDARAYYLDSPEVITKIFVDENDTTLLQVNIDSFNITKSDNGYTLLITTISGDTYKAIDDKDLFVQLAYIPVGEKDRAYLNGVLVSKTESGERVFSFDLSTNFNIDSNDSLYLNKFLMYTTEPRLTGTRLTTEFDVLFSTSEPLGLQYQASSIDSKLGNFLLPNTVYGITNEKLRIKFGSSLRTLWSRTRSAISSLGYQTYEVDIPRLYTENIYARDANGSAISFDSNGNVVMTLLHEKGDPVLDADGNSVLLHAKGDIVLNAAGEPIVTSERSMIRQLDLMLLEGVYYFATDQIAINYRNLLTQTLVSWLVNDLENITDKLLEQTNIYFYPNTTLGSVKVLVDAGIIKNIDASQAFAVTLAVSDIVYNDSLLREKLMSSTITTIGDQLKYPVVSIDKITSALREQYGEDVISVKVEGLGGTNNYQVVTMVDNSQRLSIGKRLSTTGDNKLIVEEDIEIAFIKYSV